MQFTPPKKSLQGCKSCKVVLKVTTNVPLFLSCLHPFWNAVHIVKLKLFFFQAFLLQILFYYVVYPVYLNISHPKSRRSFIHMPLCQQNCSLKNRFVFYSLYVILPDSISRHCINFMLFYSTSGRKSGINVVWWLKHFL